MKWPPLWRIWWRIGFCDERTINLWQSSRYTFRPTAPKDISRRFPFFFWPSLRIFFAVRFDPPWEVDNIPAYLTSWSSWCGSIFTSKRDSWSKLNLKYVTLRWSNIAMENPPFEDVFPIQDGDFPLLCLFTGGYTKWCEMYDRHLLLWNLHHSSRGGSAILPELVPRISNSQIDHMAFEFSNLQIQRLAFFWSRKKESLKKPCKFENFKFPKTMVMYRLCFGNHQHFATPRTKSSKALT